MKSAAPHVAPPAAPPAQSPTAPPVGCPAADPSDRMAPLRHFVAAMNGLLQTVADERPLLAAARAHLAELIASDHWLPADCAQARPDSYAQYLLYLDPQQRFSVLSFVWGPGQRTPVHDHTVWGLVGVLRGAERCEEFDLAGAQPRASGRHHTLHAGDIEAVSPTLGDWHRVANALDDLPSISIHVYGADIGAVRRHRLDEQGRVCEFVSGYSAAAVPDLAWRPVAVATADLAGHRHPCQAGAGQARP